MKKALFCILLILKTLEVVAQSPRFSFASDAVTLEISENQQKSTFQVYKGLLTAVDQTYGKKAILGSFVESSTHVRFVPLVPFQKNSYYTIIYHKVTYPFRIDLNTSYERLEVEMLYPNTTTLPSNFLKWYIRFSKPVSPSKIYDHIYLLDHNNIKVDRALLPLESPLVSDDGTLLTVWIEPGRQKRDLGPNKRLGEVLVPNESYTLVIDKSLKDQQGIPMNAAFTHSFTITPPDRIQPSISSWKLRLPDENTKAILYIDFQEILDYGSLQNTLQILDASGKEIAGNFTFYSSQNGIYFKPINKWHKGFYKIVCKPIIEDVSGNNLERLFDRDITIQTKPPLLERTFKIE